MAKVEDLEKVLELEPVQSVPTKEIEVIDDTNEKNEEDDLNEDVDNARANMYELIEKGNNLLDKITELASLGDTARTYEVAGDIWQKLVQAQKDLIELHQRKASALGKDRSNKPSPSINIEGNAVFAGSTTQLMKKLEAGNKE